MELIRGLHNLRHHHRGCVLTIGNFDGVHLGHQEILQLLAEHAAQLSVPSCLMSFEPLPQEYFGGDHAPPRLTRLREKWCALQNGQLDRLLCLRFSRQLAAMPAEAFVRDILVDALGVRFLVVGDDFRFGYKRQGDFALLKLAGRKYGFEVVDSPTHRLRDERISSTRIRQALAEGCLELAAHMLGRPYTMCGRVFHGDKRGRGIGFPTANILLHRKRSPVRGVYVVSVDGITEQPLYGVANVGTRPTFDGQRLQLEVHLFDFDQNLYGRYVCVRFHHKLRDERRFDSFDALKAQIQKDSRDARQYITENMQDT